MLISSETERDAECPKGSLLYGDDDATWICCDCCKTWYDLDCAGFSEDDLIEEYVCEDCCNMLILETLFDNFYSHWKQLFETW